MKLKGGRQSKNIEDRRPKPSEEKTSRIKYHKAGSLSGIAMDSLIGMDGGYYDEKKEKKPVSGKENRYKVKGKKNTDNGSVPVPEDRPKNVKAGASNPATQKWKDK